MKIKLSNHFLFLTICILISIEITLYLVISNSLVNFNLGGGSDADYYDQYAKGYFDFSVNLWADLLRSLNDIGLYSRKIISFILLILHLFIIPRLACRLANLNFKLNQKLYLYLYIICLVYPTLFFYTFDIYRDVFMVFSFLVSCLAVKKMLKAKNIFSFISLFIIILFLGWFLFKLRPYLGLAFILSILLIRIKLTKNKIILFGLLYIIILFLAFTIGALDSLIEYRVGFEEVKGGSTIGLDFTNPVLFIPNLILSTFGQLFGLYVINSFAIILLLIETVPFVVMLFYIVKNIKLADAFVRFLIIFFVVYASVWLIANDNLGTAVRLRLYNYFAVYICFFYILRLKQFVTSNNMQVKK